MDCLPILRPFSALCDPLSDGTVPAKRILEIEKDLVCDPTRHLKLNDNNLWYQNGNGWRLALSLGDFECLTMSALSADYLRRHHFAVGLEPHQYIAKA